MIIFLILMVCKFCSKLRIVRLQQRFNFKANRMRNSIKRERRERQRKGRIREREKER